ncbi:hypothetical protein CRE_14672 [Caenorhabditis remanei]|uniref:Uncharacterized protein n=1 Tax=Caenorhabditis remanei TaxID=31234 RepID=E3M9G4_CAERE|nr:hypothetical protein CRE_14672 [Caenorhabditis remanei]
MGRLENQKMARIERILGTTSPFGKSITLHNTAYTVARLTLLSDIDRLYEKLNNNLSEEEKKLIFEKINNKVIEWNEIYSLNHELDLHGMTAGAAVKFVDCDGTRTSLFGEDTKNQAEIVITIQVPSENQSVQPGTTDVGEAVKAITIMFFK